MIATASSIVVLAGVTTPAQPAESLDVDAIGDLEDVRHVVADENHRHPLTPHPLDQLQHLPGLAHAERSGGLVEDDHLGPECRGTGDRDRLALATRECLQPLAYVLDGGDPELVELLARLGAHPTGVELAKHTAQRTAHPLLAAEEHVACDVERGGHGERLVDRFDARPARLSVGLLNDDRLALQQDVAAVRLQRAGQAFDQRRLAGAVVADDPRTSPALSTRSTSARPITRPNVLTRPRASSTCVALACEPLPDEHRGSFAVLPVVCLLARSCLYPPDPLVQRDGGDHEDPQREWLVEPVDVREREALGERDDDQRAEQRADHVAAAAEQAGAADHHGRDALQVRVDGVVRARGARVADRHPRSDADDQSGEHVDPEQDPIRADPGQPRRLDVVADRVHVATPLRPAKDVVDHQVEGENHEHAVDQVQRPDLQRVAGPVEDVRQLRSLGRLALRVDQPDRGEDAQRSQRHDERG